MIGLRLKVVSDKRLATFAACVQGPDQMTIEVFRAECVVPSITAVLHSSDLVFIQEPGATLDHIHELRQEVPAALDL